MPEVANIAQARQWIGRQVGVSPWLVVDQGCISRFADTTGDHQFIHVDPERAARETPFDGTVAHGFLTLSLLSCLGAEAGLVRLRGSRMMINYGLDRVRFLNPVRAGARIRGRFELLAADEKAANEFLLKHRATVEIENADKPALVAEWLSMAVT